MAGEKYAHITSILINMCYVLVCFKHCWFWVVIINFWIWCSRGLDYLNQGGMGPLVLPLGRSWRRLNALTFLLINTRMYDLNPSIWIFCQLIVLYCVLAIQEIDFCIYLIIVLVEVVLELRCFYVVDYACKWFLHPSSFNHARALVHSD